MSDIRRGLARRVWNADRTAGLGGLRPGKDEVDVLDAERAQIELFRRPERLFELRDPRFLELEPARELRPQLLGRRERPDLAFLRLDERQHDADRRDYIGRLCDVGRTDLV